MPHAIYSVSSREQLAADILQRKARLGLSWETLAAETHLSAIYVAAALLGQHRLPSAAAAAVGRKLELDDEAIASLQTIPLRSDETRPPADPMLYRFQEMIRLYAPALRALIHEQFGDGVVSAVDFKVDLKKIEETDGSCRAVITLDGKFLPYQPF